MMKLLNIGSIAFDDVKTPYGEIKLAMGGSAVYASLSSSKFVSTAILGVVGNDFSEENFAILKRNGIDTSGIEVVSGDSFHWSGVYNDLNRAETIKTDLNVFADFNPRLSENQKKCPYVFLGNIDPILQKSVLEQINNDAIVGCDTMNYWIMSKRRDLENVINNIDLLFINEDELKMLTEQSNIFQAAENILKGRLKYLIIKRGEYGSILYGKDLLFFVPVYPIKEVIDPTGAGDSFAGAFMGYIAKMDNLNSETMKKAMLYATILASYNIQSFSVNELDRVQYPEIDRRHSELLRMIIL
ncbi:MAG: PfkB family carbohydrate kinase [Candidatus Cloacimonetes bacterium]|nr:PfkB family carbohydrate kinase [Candidatus Cloacimonadota bacterium]